MTLTAVFGTTISPYLFAWQATGEVEETRLTEDEVPLRKAPWQAEDQLIRIRIDTTVGTTVLALIVPCIVLTVAYALYTHDITQVETCVRTAEALRPVADHFAQMLFAVGMIGTGLLVVLVLADSAAYTAAGTLRWHNNLKAKMYHAPKFYLFLALVVMAVMVMVFLSIEPFKLLYWAVVLNGVTATPIMVMPQLMPRRKAVMGPFCSSRLLHGTARVVALCMCANTLLFFVPTARGAQRADRPEIAR